MKKRISAARIIMWAAVMVATVFTAQAQTPPSQVLMENEELTYNVRYGFIDLGQVRIKTYGKQMLNGREVYYAKALIDSYKGIPFVDLHATFESNMDPAIFSRFFVGKSREGKQWDFSRYNFDYDAKKVYIEIGEHDTVITKQQTVDISGLMQDGLSLFFTARDRLYSGTTQDIPTFIKEEKANTKIMFTGKQASVEVDAVEYPVDVIEFEGKAEFTGIYGLSGGFEGWFSNDEARVPILAKMKVIVGSVTIELMGWKREGWKPPKAKS